MKKRLVNKRVRKDVYFKLWRKSMDDHMRNIVRLDTETCFRCPRDINFEDRYKSLSELEKASLALSNWLWSYDYQQLKTYCKTKYHLNNKDFAKLKI